MKTMKNYIWMAAIAMTAATLTACSSDELMENTNPESQGKVVTLTATLSPKGGDATTRSLSDPGDGTLTSTWAVNEEIEVQYEKSTDPADSPSGSAKATVTAVDGSGNATITVNLVDPKDGNTGIYFHYPYSLATGTKDLNDDQVGTLADVAANFDDVTGDGTLNVSGNVATLPTGVAMTRNVCVWKFTFTDGSNDITSAITALNIKVGTISEYNVTPSAQTTIYTAMFKADNQPITVTATTATGTFSKTTGAVSLAKGKLYTSTALALIKQNTVALGALTANYTASNGDVLTGTLGAAYRVIIPDGVTITLSDATIAYNDYDAPAINCLGSATIILADGTTNTVSVPGDTDGGPSGSQYPGIQIGGTGTKLQITGSGTLTAIGGYISSGIGCMHVNGAAVGYVGGQIQIDGGTINTYSGNKTALGDGAETGMGSVMGGMSGDRCEGITINGGVVTAKGGSGGLGSGLYGDKCTFVTINGGEVHAEGGDCGISAETIIINKGYVEASSEWGYGIKTNNDLTISGGTIEATGNGGNAGINAEKDLIISGGTVNATGNGGGEGIMCIGTGAITISGGNVTATCTGNPGPGIMSNGILVEDGTLTVYGGNANDGSDGDGGVGIDSPITVNGGIITATGGAKDGNGTDGLGINDANSITLGSGITMYEGDAANPATPAADQTACTKRYVIIQ